MRVGLKFDRPVFEMFFIHGLRPTLNVYNLTQFVLRFLNCFFLVFSLHVFSVRLHLQKFLYSLRADLFILIIYYSFDNDRSTVKTSCFTVGFYRWKLSCFNKLMTGIKSAIAVVEQVFFSSVRILVLSNFELITSLVARPSLP